MAQFRSVTLATKSIDKTIDLFHNMLGMAYVRKGNRIQFGDAELSPGTRLQFVEIAENIEPAHQHFESVALRTPSNDGIDEYVAILKEHQHVYEGPTHLNGHQLIQFSDADAQQFAIFSNEVNVGIGLGIPNEKSSVSPIHQVQGMGPLMLRTHEPVVTITLLSDLFGFKPIAEYTSPQTNQRVIVMEGDGGGLGAEVHIYQSDILQMPPYGIVEQLEFTAQHENEFNYALNQLNHHDIPFQQLQNEQQGTRAIRVNDISGLALILTLAHATKGS
ncbi:VOC family protein [Staphylococcus intermedius]|uniref:Glyoxalase family protein n=1 Tax=Staphylococcus intermedius NCTC 11048 TaxID=1141106 RepID=A0A380G916_STAIN|nr:VOC family protein [Staphylococcus intermedius]PCF64932.1 lactoylglutathione lyase [Staphylococcus intermedius]PCF80543.1 lactoylglutathione lyase [Staphylococcus intermedius]PCF81892.1 lactoylglutathione lyase [Staphylococcus intermedius]PCF88228.1 lactoylglutathione lyase [Staphylococcus intermedius]PCF88943.1 lactoylglutathione lyase [Staphylococcus intermedius]